MKKINMLKNSVNYKPSECFSIISGKIGTKLDLFNQYMIEFQIVQQGSTVILVACYTKYNMFLWNKFNENYNVTVGKWSHAKPHRNEQQKIWFRAEPHVIKPSHLWNSILCKWIYKFNEKNSTSILRDFSNRIPMKF